MKIQVAAMAGLCSWVSAQPNAETLTFGTEEFPPFSMVQNGRATGPLAEIVQAVCTRIQVRCEIKVLPWRRAMKMVEQGELSGAFPLARLPVRERIFYFGDPIVDTAYAAYTVRGHEFKYTQPKDFGGHTIGVYGPSGTSMTLEGIVSGVPHVRVVTEIDNLTVLKKLTVGRYGESGLGFVNRDVARYLIAQEKFSNIQPAGDVKPLQYYIGLTRQVVSETRANSFRRAYQELLKTGKIKLILEKHDLKLMDQMVEDGSAR